MSSEHPQHAEAAEAYVDAGLLNPVWAGSVVAKLTSDRSYVRLLLHVEAAWCAVLAEYGLGTAEEAERAARTAKSPDFDVLELARAAQGGGNPLIPVLAQMRALVGNSKSLHMGATSQDIMDTALMMMARRTGASILDDIRHTVQVLVDLARAHAETPMVARSLGQHSLPSTFGLRVAGWATGLVQAAQDLETVLEELPIQWFGAAGTMASLSAHLQRVARQQQSSGITEPLDPFDLVDALAHRLELAPAPGPWDTIRVIITNLASSLANVNVACGKIANDVLISARLENGELAEPTAPGRGGSSAMPHKQNPVLSVMINSATLSAPGILAQIYTAAGAAHEERPDGAWHAEWPALRQLMRTAGGAATLTRELVTGLRVNPEAMERNLGIAGPMLVSERIMAELAPIFEDSEHPGSGRQAIQDIVNACLADSTRDLKTDLGQALAGRVPDTELDAILDVTQYTGEAVRLVERMIATPEEWSHRS